MDSPRVHLKILKPIFGKRADGVLAIEHMAIVPLEPDDGKNTDFYRVRDDLFTLQPNYIGTIHSTLSQSIVPIVAISPTNRIVLCLGTGFFISCTGLLITAAHVVTDPIDRNYGDVREIEEGVWSTGSIHLGVMIETNPIFYRKGHFFRPIEWAAFLAKKAEHPLPIKGVDLRLTADAAICKVAPLGDGLPYQPLSIVQPGIRGVGLGVGKKAIAVGYSGMEDVELDPASNRLKSGQFRFNLHVSSGEILERYPENAIKREASTPGPCFSASLSLPAGMSGSPIFDDERIYVHGVVSRGLEDENGPTNFGYGSMLASLLSLPLGPIEGKSLLDLIKAGDSGIPKMFIPDA